MPLKQKKLSDAIPATRERALVLAERIWSVDVEGGMTLSDRHIIEHALRQLEATLPSGTNEDKKLRKLERLVRRAFHGLAAIKYVELAQSYRGGAGSVFVGNACMRGILKTLDELDELRDESGSRAA